MLALLRNSDSFTKLDMRRQDVDGKKAGRNEIRHSELGSNSNGRRMGKRPRG